MTSYPEKEPDSRAAAHSQDSGRGKPPRLVATAFVLVFSLSVATVIFTGLMVEAPRTELAAGLPVVGMAVGEPHTVNLVFTSGSALEDVTLLLTLPDGVELSGHRGETQMAWRTRLGQGRNLLPLELVANAAGGGQLSARLSHGEQAKLFRVHLNVVAE